MNQLFLFKDSAMMPSLLFLSMYLVIIIYLAIMIFRYKPNGDLIKVFIAILSIFSLLLLRRDDTGALIIQCTLFTTPFVLIFFQRIEMVRKDLSMFLIFMGGLWGIFIGVELLVVLDLIAMHAYRSLLAVMMIFVNLSFAVYFCYGCSVKNITQVQEIPAKLFHEIFLVILVYVISAYIVIFVLIDTGNMYALIFAFFALYSVHLVFIYSNCMKAPRKNYRYPAKEVAEDERDMLEDESVSEESFILERLIHLLEQDKLYLSADITVSDVATKIYTNRTYLSRALNNRTAKNFNQFINYYRIKEVCDIFINNPELKIQSIYERCGFNSLSSFSSSFKLNTGYTPAEWAKEVRCKQKNHEEVKLLDYIL